MNVREIVSAICRYFNGREEFSGCPFIQSPSNAPAPKENYIAVSVESVEQHGSEMRPAPGEGVASGFEQVATVAFTEVEGDGDNIRRVRNEMQCREFLESVAWPAGFTVWDFTDIISVDTFDGEFFVRQWRFTLRANFEDMKNENVPKIESVEPLELKAI